MQGRESFLVAAAGLAYAPHPQIMQAAIFEPASGAAQTHTAPAFSAAELESLALAATYEAALACQQWVGRGDGKAADRAATEAMRRVLAASPHRGTVVVGEGAKDRAPMLYDGEVLGGEGALEFDIAVDPLECTKLCARGLAGSLATIAFAPRGSMAALAASFYMEKLVASPALCGVLDIREPPEQTLRRAARALGCRIGELRVTVLDKPRHERLIAALRGAGAQVCTPSDGDVAGALEALLPDGGSDLLMGVGGTPEGVMSACAARALGGLMQARLAPQSKEEARALADAGLDAERVFDVEELVGGESLFAATGVSGGALLARPRLEHGWQHSESILIGSGAVRRVREARRAAASPSDPERREGAAINTKSEEGR
jgi:fructose-1,6-bisphosphatase II